jgi:hypothetical protein
MQNLLLRDDIATLVAFADTLRAANRHECVLSNVRAATSHVDWQLRNPTL